MKKLLAVLAFLLFTATAWAADVQLAWDANDPAPDGYVVFQRVEGDDYGYTAPIEVYRHDTGESLGNNVPADVNHVKVQNLTAGITYYFVVRAFVGPDMSGDSNEVSYRPSIPVANPGGLDKITAEQQFTVYRDPATGQVVITIP